ncbi:MAG TPA: hypothetical protein PKD72_12075, partial [Gemmatales bacterium]|nr:hypothetical protein [Gemmatales bacterium]
MNQPWNQNEAEGGFLRSWAHFWFTSRSALSLHMVRAGFGIVGLVWLLSYAGHVNEFFGYEGW